MRQLTVSVTRSVAVVLLALVFIASAGLGDAHAAAKQSSSGGKTISVKNQKVIIEIQEILEADRNKEAIQKLNAMGNLAEQPVYDQAVINQLYAQAYIGMDNYEQAVKYLERVISIGQDQLPPEQVSQMKFNIGQLYIAIGADKEGAAAQGFFKKGISTLEAWFAENPNARPDSYATLATAYLAIQPPNYPKAISWLERTIAKAKELNEEPKEGWYRNLAGLYTEVNQFSKALELMEFLVAKYPKRDYWMQLAYIYGELNRPKDQFAALEAAYRQGLLTSSNELVYLAQLYMQNEIPIRGAKIIEEGLAKGTIEKKADNYRLVADGYYTAKELDNAIKWYGQAGQMSEGAEPYFFLGQIFMQKEDWEKAIDAFENTIRKNNSAPKDKKLRMIGNAHYNLGIAYFYEKKCDDAKRAFSNASQFDSQRTGANQWIARINAGSCGS